MPKTFSFIHLSQPDAWAVDKAPRASPDDQSIIRSRAAKNPWNRIAPDAIAIQQDREDHLEGHGSHGTSGSSTPASWRHSQDHDEPDDEQYPIATDLPLRFIIASASESTSAQTRKPFKLITRRRKDDRDLYPINFSDFSTASPITNTTDGLRPFWTLPVPYSATFSEVLSYRMAVQSCPIPVLDKDLRDFESSACIRMFKRYKDCAAFMYAILLFSGAHFLCGGTPDNPHAQYFLTRSTIEAIGRHEHLIWLRGAAITAINEALCDGAGALDADVVNPLIAAISILACFEFYFGDRRLHRLHNQGSALLIKQQGGVQALDDINRQFTLFKLKTVMRGNSAGWGGPNASEYRAVVSACREVFEEPARQMGLDLSLICDGADEKEPKTSP